MKLPRLATTGLALLLLAGCASQPTTPDWVAGNSAKYKSEQYLLGRGQAATQEEAKDRARADIAKVFQVAVVVNSDDVQRSKSDATGAMRFEQQSSRQISTRTDKIISGIHIAELWQDPANGNHHVLALLPRLQTAATLRQQIGELDDTTRNYIEQSRKDEDLFMKIADATRALQTQQERDAMQKNLQIVDITGRGVEPKWSSAKLKSDLGELVKRVSIAPRVTAGSPAGLKEMVAGALAQSGFVLDTGDQPTFVVQATLNLVDLGLKDGWYWQRGNLEVALVETAGNRIRGTRQWIVKGNAQNKEGSTRRAMDQADGILRQELGAGIIEMAIAR